jgi:hypothetical protein
MSAFHPEWTFTIEQTIFLQHPISGISWSMRPRRQQPRRFAPGPRSIRRVKITAVTANIREHSPLLPSPRRRRLARTRACAHMSLPTLPTSAASRKTRGTVKFVNFPSVEIPQRGRNDFARAAFSRRAPLDHCPPLSRWRPRRGCAWRHARADLHVFRPVQRRRFIAAH